MRNSQQFMLYILSFYEVSLNLGINSDINMEAFDYYNVLLDLAFSKSKLMSLFEPASNCYWNESYIWSYILVLNDLDEYIRRYPSSQ